ncbi:MAG TPA: right-handed parallel beta-helix repeat-containing protein [Solirubrobacteraceae bacterium]
MRSISYPVGRRACAVFAVVVALGLPAVAQALPTQTWVSGVGNDANPCSRTAPCKTFAGAIGKTEVGGIISVLDPGGFGAVTITKAITIDAGGVFAGVLVAGTNGIVVNAPGAKVTLRGLTIEYAPPCAAGGSALSGILLSAGSLSVQDVGIHGFPGDAIDANASAEGSSLSVAGSDLRDNCSGGVVASTTAGRLAATVSGNLISNDTTGVSAGAGSQVSINANTIADNATGLSVAAGATLFSLDDNRLAGNGTNGATPVELISPFTAPVPTPAPVVKTVVALLPPTCRVPKLSGSTLAKARKALAKARCVLGAVSYREAKHKRRGLIYAQQPKAGVLQFQGAIVNVTLDGHPAPVKKPRARRSLGAGASRTWVSGVGDDLNPCSREAPCKTFAGALAKTATGGTVDALDPGDFGPVVLTAAASNAGTVTIQGNPGATIEVPAGSTGVVVDSGAGANVILRDLNIISTPGCSAAGTGTGIDVLSGSNLSLEDVRISGFPDTGLKVEAPPGVAVTVHGSSIYDNCGSGISAQGAGVGVTTDGTQMINNPVGVVVGTGAIVRLGESTVSGSVTALSTSGTGAIQGWPDNDMAGDSAIGATPGLLGFI